MTSIRLSSTALWLLIILLLAAFIRFYNFPNRVTFGPEQAISLITSGDYLKVKPSLLGDPNLIRFTSFGHQLYHSPVFNYSLIPLLLIFDNNPLPITGYFALLNLFTGLALFYVTSKIRNKTTAFFATILFLFNSTMIYHSLFIWNLDYMPLLSVFVIYLLYKYYKKSTGLLYPLLLGILAGISMGMEFFYFFTAVIVGLVIYYLSKQKIVATLIFIGGILLANLPIVVFDLKHNFYFTFTYWRYLLDTIQLPGQSSLSYYHFLQFWPLLAIFAGAILTYFYRRSRSLALGMVGIYFIFTALYGGIRFDRASGMSAGLTLAKVEQAVEVIAFDNPEKFNVATMMDFDSRAHPLRYFLRFKYGLEPDGVEQYKVLDALYVFARSGYDFDKAMAYEINSYRPFKSEVLKRVDQDYSVYKLTRN